MREFKTTHKIYVKTSFLMFYDYLCSLNGYELPLESRTYQTIIVCNKLGYDCKDIRLAMQQDN